MTDAPLLLRWGLVPGIAAPGARNPWAGTRTPLGSGVSETPCSRSIENRGAAPYRGDRRALTKGACTPGTFLEALGDIRRNGRTDAVYDAKRKRRVAECADCRDRPSRNEWDTAPWGGAQAIDRGGPADIPWCTEGL